MKKLVKYFHPKQKENYFKELKTRFFIYQALLMIPFFLFLTVASVIFQNDNSILSFIARASVTLIMIASLYLLKYKGIKFAGNVFIITVVSVVTISMNILIEDIPVMYKYTDGFYATFVILAYGLLFSNRTVLLINSGLFFITTTHIYIFSTTQVTENTVYFKSGYINHSLMIMLITIVFFVIHKFTELAINKAIEEAENQKFQNQELQTSEEELRASNEELIATTDALKDSTDGLIKAKEKAEANEEKLKKLSIAVRQSATTIVVTDANGDIEYVNPKFTEITGYSEKEAIGKNPRLLKAGTQSDGYYTEMWKAISSGKAWKGEFHNKTKEGRFYWEKANITPIKDYEGKITSYLAVKEDITEIKETEKQIMNAIIEAEERERNHFSRELHDGLGPVLSTLKMYFEWMSKTEEKEKKELIITNGMLNIDEAISIVEEISNKLTPRTLNAFGFPAALETFIARLNVSDTKINFTSNLKKRLEINHEAAIYRVLTELINNTLKHAKAKKINISIEYSLENETLEIQYSDDGIGFDYKDKLNKGNGFGLMNMQQRIKTFEGSLKFITKIGQGSKVFITFDKLKVKN